MNSFWDLQFKRKQKLGDSRWFLIDWLICSLLDSFAMALFWNRTWVRNPISLISQDSNLQACFNFFFIRGWLLMNIGPILLACFGRWKGVNVFILRPNYSHSKSCYIFNFQVWQMWFIEFWCILLPQLMGWFFKLPIEKDVNHAWTFLS